MAAAGSQVSASKLLAACFCSLSDSSEHITILSIQGPARHYSGCGPCFRLKKVRSSPRFVACNIAFRQLTEGHIIRTPSPYLTAMQLAMIGLGKMGGNMARRLLQHGHDVIGFDLNADAVSAFEQDGGRGTTSLEDLPGLMDAPRTLWIMVPAGGPVDAVINKLRPNLDKGDLLIDGGNSNFHDTERRAKELQAAGLHYVDVGVSGGIWGLTEGYSMMVGGSEEAVARLTPALKSLAPAPDKGWGHVGPNGAGHHVKMVHNGSEYGWMQAYAEGLAILDKKSDFDGAPVDFDLHQIAEIWRYGSVVRSWLLDLAANALSENPSLDGLAPYVPDSGEGRWTIVESIDLDVPAPVITLALQQRFQSRVDDSFAFKLLSALRGQFGGHAVKKE